MESTQKVLLPSEDRLDVFLKIIKFIIYYLLPIPIVLYILTAAGNFWRADESVPWFVYAIVALLLVYPYWQLKSSFDLISNKETVDDAVNSINKRQISRAIPMMMLMFLSLGLSGSGPEPQYPVSGVGIYMVFSAIFADVLLLFIYASRSQFAKVRKTAIYLGGIIIVLAALYFVGL